jgi:hypothetical protein
MSIYPCSACGKRHPGKLATAYNAWFLEDGQRVAYRQRLCVGCLKDELGEVIRNQVELADTAETCPACGGSNENGDLDPTFVTVYLPGRDPAEFGLNTCVSCAAKLRVELRRGEDRLADRGAMVRGPSPLPPVDWGSALLESTERALAAPTDGPLVFSGPTGHPSV